MEKKQLEQWLSEIDNAIAETKLSSSKSSFWQGQTLNDTPYLNHISSMSKPDKNADRRKTVEQKRQEKIEEEMESLKNPSLSRGTQQIIFKSKREGKIEDRLLHEGQKKKQEAFEREAKLRTDAKQKSMPIITPLASALKREGDVVERLYDYQKLYQEKKDMLKKEIEPEPTLPVPKINKSSVESRYMKPSKSSVAIEEHSYKPEISERSLKLAAKLGDPKDRLLNKPASKPVMDTECTFAPSIIRKDDKEEGIWWERLYHQGKIVQEKKEKQKEELEKKKIDPECTFKPKIQGSEKKEGVDDRVRRFQDWQKSREEKIKQNREENNSRGLEECTFAPKV